MAEKILNTRIQLKYDTLANWNNSTFILKRGEIAVVEVPNAEGSTLQPVMFKVGDDVKTFSQLDWASAKAADVYGWAKTKAPELDGQVIKFKNASDVVVHSIDLSTFVTHDELTTILSGYQPKGNYKVVQTAVENKITDADHVLSTLSQNENGDIAYGVKKLTPADIGAKAVQDAKSFTGSTIKTATVVTQDTNGVINVTFEDIAFPEDKDTNTAHTHKDGVGTKSSGGGIDGEVAVDLNIAMELINGEIVIYDKNDSTKEPIANMDASDFIKDGMITSVELKDSGEGYPEGDGPYLVFTWNIDNATGEDDDTLNDVLWVPVKDLVDVYTAGTGITITNNVIAHQAKPASGDAEKVVAGGTGRTYVTEVLVDGLGHIAGVKTATETDQDLTHDHDDEYKKLQEEVVDPTANGKALAFIDSISQNENGEITATKKNVNLDDYALKSEIPTDFGVTKITSNDTTPSDKDDNVSGLKITPATGTGEVNIEIDDTVTFIFNCGSATVNI